MITLTPALLIAAANSFVGLGEDGGDNRGQMVEMFLREVNQPPGQPWCAAFVYHVGFASHFDHRVKKSSWPFPATASCEELGDWARKRELLRKEPFEGDVFLHFSLDLNRFAHTGIVVSVDQRVDEKQFVCTTVEGNTNDDGSRDGRTTLRKSRHFRVENGDRFIRWPDLGFRAKAA
jgi:hypothetical protein